MITETLETQHATTELFAALAKAQGEIENATKNANNPHFKNDYADLAEVLNTIRPVFAKQGLSIIQSPSYDGSRASVTTVIAHESGGWIAGMASCVPAKSDAQGIGAATTYLRRYSAAGMAGIAQEDDDGNAAAHNGKPEPAQQRKAKPQGAPKAQLSARDGELVKYGSAAMNKYKLSREDVDSILAGLLAAFEAKSYNELSDEDFRDFLARFGSDVKALAEAREVPVV